MTKSELSQYYYLCREIEQSERDLRALQKKAAAGSIAPSAVFSKTKKCIDADSEYTVLIDEQAELIKEVKFRAEREKHRILIYIKGIDDSLTRMIFKYRYIDMLSWRAVAIQVGGNNTEDSVRKIAYRYIKKDG